MNSMILDALKAIPVSQVDYSTWLQTGMALKHEGYSCDVWDQWSQNDERYKQGECNKKWETFGTVSHPVTGGSIVALARSYGWKPTGNYEDRGVPENEFDGVEQLRRYLTLLFEPDDYVAYLTESYPDADGKWKPGGKGCFDRTCKELLASLDQYPDDLGATIGDWKPEAGAWIRFNPLDGRGTKNENVTAYRYTLVESDSMPLEEQERLYRELELPIAVMVYSGGKSIHAICHIDAKNKNDYRKRVDFLYQRLEEKGLVIDKQNRNESRLSRMPGVTRGMNRQYILAENIGKPDWDSWFEGEEGVNDGLPDIVRLGEYWDNPPTPPEELIHGILRRGHKMLVSGPSKAGKSFLLMELCVALAEGLPWLGIPCSRCRVLYINLEIDPNSAILRLLKIYKAMGLTPEHMNEICIWNLRGFAEPLDELAPKIIRRVKNQGFGAIILDPIYKTEVGDENNASDMGYFCNQFDKIVAGTGCSMIYCHHHSKGAQGQKKAQDRASGSGVFARDPDAVVDIIELDLSEDIKNFEVDEHATAWRMECALREFPNPRPVNFWFRYPIHYLDDRDILKEAAAEGSFKAGRLRNRKNTTAEDRKTSVLTAFQACAVDGRVMLKDMAEYSGVTPRCIRDRLKEVGGFEVKNNEVFRVEPKEEENRVSK